MSSMQEKNDSSEFDCSLLYELARVSGSPEEEEEEEYFRWSQESWPLPSQETLECRDMSVPNKRAKTAVSQERPDCIDVVVPHELMRAKTAVSQERPDCIDVVVPRELMRAKTAVSQERPDCIDVVVPHELMRAKTAVSLDNIKLQKLFSSWQSECNLHKDMLLVETLQEQEVCL